jgi:iron complex outermembrane recepter protein
MNRIRLAGLGLSALAVTAPQAAPAQSTAPGASMLLEAITVEGKAQTAAETARARLEAIPGGASVIETQGLSGKADVTLSDALRTAPGVVVQNFFGGNDQPRVQIRGSGLQQNPVERGVLALWNGLPLNRADGAYIVGSADPRGAEFIEVYRGHAANRLAATVLGGAINFVSPTGISAPGVMVGTEIGSFGQFNTTAQAGGRYENADGLIRLSRSRRDGYRDYNAGERTNVDANLGVRLSDNVAMRFFVGHTDLEFDVAGPVPKTWLENSARAPYTGPRVVNGVAVGAGPNVVRDQPQRDVKQTRGGARASAAFGAHAVDVTLGYARTDDEFRFPISSGVRVTRGGDLTATARYAYAPDAAQPLPLFEATAAYIIGSADREDYINNRGRRGVMFGRSKLDAATLSASAGLNLPLGHGLTLSPVLAAAHATRDNADRWGAATRPTIAFSPTNPNQALPNGAVAAGNTGYSHDYSGFTPSLGLTWRADADQTFFGAVSRGFEPPTHDDLLATVNGTPNSSAGRPNPANPAQASSAYRTPDLKAQTATTVEAGWRGRVGTVKTDATVYYSWLKNELLSLRDATGASLGAVNADQTRHFGIEFGATAQLTETISGRLGYTFQDFRFDDDPVRGNNKLAGAPPHVVSASLRWQATDGLVLRTEADWRVAKTPVDNMNTLYADPFITVDVGADYTLNERLSIYGEARNVFNATYASSTLIVDQANATQAAYIPGDGRAFYLGLKVKF